MNYAIVAKAMCIVTEELLWKPRIGWALERNPTADLRLRVGSGKKTYLSIRNDSNRNASMTITYGVKMVESVTDPISLGQWLTSREIRDRGYYGGQITLLNVLAHTIAHEFGHFVQAILGRYESGSVHNAGFYEILDRIHARGEAERIREALYKRCLVHNIDLRLIGELAQSSCLPALTMKDIRLNQELWFRNPKMAAHNPVRVTEKRRTRIVVASVSDEGQKWVAPPGVLSLKPAMG